MRFSEKPPDDFEKMSFGDIARKHLSDPDRYSEADFAQARKNLTLIEERNRTDIKENSLLLDKHLVWLSGGALVVVANMFLSDKINAMEWRELLPISFFAFGISIIAVVTSYRKTLQSLVCIPLAQAASNEIEELMRDMKKIDPNTPEAEKAKLRDNLENQFNDFKKNVAKGRSIEKWVPICNGTAYYGFIIGMCALLIFGFANLL